MMQKPLRFFLIALTILCLSLTALAVTLLPKSTVLAEENKTVLKTGESPIVSVSGSGTTNVDPDVVYINLGVSTEHFDPKIAIEQNNEKMTALITALKKEGVEEKDIRGSSFRLDPKYDYSKNVRSLNGYAAVNELKVIVREVKKAGQILGSAVAAGGNTIESVSYDLLDKTKVYNEALKKAVKEATGKAEAIAKEAGFSKVKIKTITENGAASPYGVARNMVAGAGLEKMAADMNVPLGNGELAVQANVVIEFDMLP